MSRTRILVGDVRERLGEIPDGSIQTCVTSPPYWGLRDYGCDGQIGLEQTPEEYVAEMVGVFREVRRCLRDDGTLWLNIGDSYAANRSYQVTPTKWESLPQGQSATVPDGLKPKDLVGIPWRLAFALQADGWFLRSDIIWSKPNPMPESVRDRPTKAHEYVFLLSKSGRYFYDAEAISEDLAGNFAPNHARTVLNNGAQQTPPGSPPHSGLRAHESNGTRNARTVWTIPTQPFPGSHFAVMPPELAERCIRAGSKEGDTVLDTFGGAGTTPLVANRLNRDAIICELNPGYAEMARERVYGDAPMFRTVEVLA